jgi:nucleotide-binding universal stress UspA family protein
VIMMFARILVAIDDFGESQAVLDLVKGLATEGTAQMHVVHCRLRELSGYSWYARESRGEASFQAEAAVFDLRMAGSAAGAAVRYAIVDRVGEAILAEASDFDADLIVLGPPRRRELAARLFGSVTQRVVQRAKCPVIIAPRTPGRPQASLASDPAATGRS